jgi:hypothetical protein
MDISRLPERLRRRAEELERRPTLEKVRSFLGGFVADMESFDEIRAGMRQVAASSTFGLKREMRALDEFLAEPQPPGVLAELVAWDANWRLDDPSDQGAEAFLRQIADMLRDALAEVDYDGILDKVRPHGFTPEEVRDYEIAIHIINSVIAIYSARYHERRDDPVAAEPFRAEIRRWARVRESLSPGDGKRVAEIRHECGAIVREARRRLAP